MKLCKSNIFLNKIFIKDDDPNTSENFRYDIEEDCQVVCVSESPELSIVQRNAGENVNIIPIGFESEKQFNLLVINALLMSCRINNNIVNSVREAETILSAKSLGTAYALISDDFVINSFNNKEYDKSKILRVKGLNKNQILLVPYAEFLGVIPVYGVEMNRYGICVINSRGPVLVERTNE